MTIPQNKTALEPEPVAASRLAEAADWFGGFSRRGDDLWARDCPRCGSIVALINTADDDVVCIGLSYGRDIICQAIPGIRHDLRVFGYDNSLMRLMRADAGRGISFEDDRFDDDPAKDPNIRLKIIAALTFVPSDAYEVWFRVAAALRTTLGDSGFQIFDDDRFDHGQIDLLLRR